MKVVKMAYIGLVICGGPGNGPSPRSEEAFTDRFGIRAALIGLCIASLIAAIWFVRSPSFEKCSAIGNVTDRNACYDQLRQELFKPPAKNSLRGPCLLWVKSGHVHLHQPSA